MNFVPFINVSIFPVFFIYFRIDIYLEAYSTLVAITRYLHIHLVSIKSPRGVCRDIYCPPETTQSMIMD